MIKVYELDSLMKTHIDQVQESFVLNNGQIPDQNEKCEDIAQKMFTEFQDDLMGIIEEQRLMADAPDHPAIEDINDPNPTVKGHIDVAT